MTDLTEAEEERAYLEYCREDGTWELEVGRRVYHEELYQQMRDGEILEKMYRDGEIAFADLPTWAQEAEVERLERAAGWDPNP